MQIGSAAASPDRYRPPGAARRLINIHFNAHLVSLHALRAVENDEHFSRTSAGAACTEVETSVESGIHCTLRVTARENELARVTVRRHQFVVGRPVELDHASERIAALEFALGALAAEVVNGVRVFAARRRLEVDAIEALLTSELTRGLAYLEVVGEPGPPTLGRVRVKVYVTTNDETAMRSLWGELLERLPLVCTLRLAVPIEFELLTTR